MRRAMLHGAQGMRVLMEHSYLGITPVELLIDECKVCALIEGIVSRRPVILGFSEMFPGPVIEPSFCLSTRSPVRLSNKSIIPYYIFYLVVLEALRPQLGNQNIHVCFFFGCFREDYIQHRKLTAFARHLYVCIYIKPLGLGIDYAVPLACPFAYLRRQQIIPIARVLRSCIDQLCAVIFVASYTEWRNLLQLRGV